MHREVLNAVQAKRDDPCRDTRLRSPVQLARGHDQRLLQHGNALARAARDGGQEGEGRAQACELRGRCGRGALELKRWDKVRLGQHGPQQQVRAVHLSQHLEVYRREARAGRDARVLAARNAAAPAASPPTPSPGAGSSR